MAAYLEREGPWTDAEILHRTAADAAHHLDAPQAEADALRDLGRVRYLTGDLAEAADLAERAHDLFHDLGSRLGQANALQELGQVSTETGDFTAAAGFLKRARTLFRQVGDLQGEAEVLNATGDLHAAAIGPGPALVIYQRIGVAEAASATGFLKRLESEARLTSDQTPSFGG